MIYKNFAVCFQKMTNLFWCWILARLFCQKRILWSSIDEPFPSDRHHTGTRICEKSVKNQTALVMCWNTRISKLPIAKLTEKSDNLGFGQETRNYFFLHRFFCKAKFSYRKRLYSCSSIFARILRYCELDIHNIAIF